MHLQSVNVDNKTNVANVVLKDHEKVVYFLRHGQSEANIGLDSEKHLPKFKDAPLTSVGHAQAIVLGERVSGLTIQTVVSSPLTRTLQTSCRVFEKTSHPIVAWPLVTEFYPEMQESKGRVKEELSNCQHLTTLPRFKTVHLENVVGDWWEIAGDPHRLDAFLSWLRWCPETRIAVVCHWGFIMNLLNRCGYGQEIELTNCVCVSTVWHPSPLEIRSNTVDVFNSTDMAKAEYAVWLLPDMTRASALMKDIHGTDISKAEYAVWLLPDMTRASVFMKEIQGFFKKCTENPKLSKSKGIQQSGGKFHITLADFFTADYAQVQEIAAAVQRGAAMTVEQGGFLQLGNKDAEPEMCGHNELTLFYRIKAVLSWLSPLRNSLVPLDCYENTSLVRGENNIYNATLLLDNQPTSGSLTLADFRTILNEHRYPILDACVRGDEDEFLKDEWITGFKTTRWKVAVMKRQNGHVEIEPGTIFTIY